LGSGVVVAMVGYLCKMCDCEGEQVCVGQWVIKGAFEGVMAVRSFVPMRREGELAEE
jgi:hypothetical protein